MVQEISFEQKRQERIVVESGAGPVRSGVGNGRLVGIRRGSDNRIGRPHRHQQTARGDSGRFVRPSHAQGDWSAAAREACAFRAAVDRVSAAAQIQSVDRRTTAARQRGNVAHQQRPSGRLQPVHPVVREADNHEELVTGAVRRPAVVLITDVAGPRFAVASTRRPPRASRVIRYVT